MFTETIMVGKIYITIEGNSVNILYRLTLLFNDFDINI